MAIVTVKHTGRQLSGSPLGNGRNTIRKRPKDQKVEFLLYWVREYESRTDEYSLARHRELFEGFRGPTVELSSLPS